MGKEDGTYGPEVCITFQVSGGIERLSEQDILELRRLLAKVGFHDVVIFGTSVGDGERETVFEMAGPGADASVVDAG